MEFFGTEEPQAKIETQSGMEISYLPTDKVLIPVDSALVVLDWKTSLTADKTLGFKVTIEYSTNNSTWSTPEFLFGATGSYETVETGADTNKYGQWTYRLQLSPEEQYFRISVTPDLSHTGTDTAVFGFGALLGGSTVNPISQYDTVVTY
jgi:hypothetical protein